MPFTFPTQTICPFCFHRFYIGFTPIRDSSNPNMEPDEALRDFLELPPGSVLLAPIIYPPGGFIYYFSSSSSRSWSRWWSSLGNTGRILLFLPIVLLILFLASISGLRWLFRFIYFSPVNKSAHHSRRRVCPHCHLPLPNVVANKGTCSNIIAVTGYRRVGKSNFFAVLVETLKNRYNKETGFAINFSETFSTATMSQASSDDLFHGRYGSLFLEKNPKPVPGTRSARQDQDIRLPLIYRLAIKRPWWDWIQRPFSRIREVDLVFFDAAGEDMGSESARAIYGRYIRNASGIIALVDPLNSKEIRGFLDESKKREQPELFDTVGAIINNLQANEWRKPLALVLTKLDMLEDLPDFTNGDFKELFEDHKHNGGYNREAGDKASLIVRDFLDKYKFNQLLTSIDTHFPTHCFFALSALGKNPNEGRLDGPIQPINIADPLFWILHQNGVLRADKDTPNNYFRHVKELISIGIKKLSQIKKNSA